MLVPLKELLEDWLLVLFLVCSFQRLPALLFSEAFSLVHLRLSHRFLFSCLS